jgi:RNA polymerase sigma-70 factor (ECF subfamily)
VGTNPSVTAIAHWQVTLGLVSASYIVNGDDCLTMNIKAKRLVRFADDAALVAAAKSGDVDSLELLVRKHQSPVFALALSRVGTAAAAEEIAQESLIRACQRLDQLKEPERFPLWLRAITKRQIAMWVRSKRRESVAFARFGEEMERHTPPERPADGGADRIFDISALIAALPAKLRAAAALCLEDELPPKTAAAILGLKPATLRKRLHDVRARLQRQIVAKAEAELRLQLLPKDFAHKCVCGCARAREASTGKEVTTMTRKSKCGCGCVASSKGSAKQPKVKTKKAGK